jgi:CBS domain-containing protein
MRMNEQTVGELMTHDPVLGIVDMSVVDAAELMEFYRVSGLPVIDWECRGGGGISQTDLLHARATESLWRAWSGLTVKHLMSRPAVTISSGASIEDAAEMMERLGIHRLVVLGPDGESPIGVLTVTDLVRSMAERDAS